MCYNVFTIKINFFKYKRFQNGRCTYKNSGWSHLNEKIKKKKNNNKKTKKNPRSPKTTAKLIKTTCIASG